MIERRILPKRSSSLSEALQSAPPALSEEGLAQRFTEQHGDTMRYVAKWGCWYIWNGKRWRRDDTLRAFSSARKIAREAAAELDQSQRNEAKAIASAKTVAAIERLARADEKHAATVDQWDGDRYLRRLNRPLPQLARGRARLHLHRHLHRHDRAGAHSLRARFGDTDRAAAVTARPDAV